MNPHCGPPPKGAGVLRHTPDEPSKPLLAAQNNPAASSVQAERDRALQLAWVCARELVGTKGTLAEITELLSDIRTLAQQQVDLLRRLISQERRQS
jgi:hypothetical protein